jgi:hypothetical protein
MARASKVLIFGLKNQAHDRTARYSSAIEAPFAERLKQVLVEKPWDTRGTVGEGNLVSDLKSSEAEILIGRFHELIDRKLLGKITWEEADELSTLRSRVRGLKALRSTALGNAAESVRTDRQQLLKAVERVAGTLRAIQRRVGKAS